MRAIGSFLVCLAALRAYRAEHSISARLRGYCLVTAVHGCIQGALLLAVPITAEIYGFEWYLARIVQLVLSVAYVIEVAERFEPKGRWFPPAIIGLVFGVTPYPKLWFNWLAFPYSMALLILGTMIVGVRDTSARIMGLYWIAMGLWQYAFLWFSGNDRSIVWTLNWWLPSALSVTAFLVLAKWSEV
jgi:hypothetical protein